MRKHTFIVLSALLFLIVAPSLAAAQQYLSPEEVLQNGDSAFLVPTRKRGAQWAVEMQDQQSIDRHPSMLEEPWDPETNAAIPPPVEEEPLQGSVIPYQDYAANAQPQTVIDPLTARLLTRLLAREAILTAPSYAQQSTAGGSGAPLAGSGPLTTIAALGIIPACVWTLRKARRLERFVERV